MTDRPNLSKSSTSTTPAAGGKPAQPRFVLIAAVALALSGLFAVLASATLYVGSVKTWVQDGARDTLSDQMNDKFNDLKKSGGTNTAANLNALQTNIKSLKRQPSTELGPTATQIKSDITTLRATSSKKGKDLLDDLDDQANTARDLEKTISTQQRSALISSIVVFVALGTAAAATYRGRYWSRWTTLGLWVLATFTGTLAGLGSVMSVAADIPALFKVPAFLSGLLLIVAVVLTNLRPSVAYFNASRPDRGNRPQRRGLFSPPARPAATAPPKEKAAATGGGADRSRTKQRSNEASVAKGAELARSRAKASKSRRTGA